MFGFKKFFTPEIKNKKSAFTLAETLITIGVIGIVAAMTIPTLMHKYRAKVYQTNLKKANSLVSQVAKRFTADEVDFEATINNNNMDTLTSYLQGEKCKFPQSIGTDLRKIYKSYYGVDFGGAAVLKLTTTQSYCLNNRMTLYLLPLVSLDGRDERKQAGHSLIVMDINGWHNSPNKSGWDLFFWKVDENGNAIPVGSENFSFMERYAIYFKYKCPGPSASQEAGITCTYDAIHDEKYFDKLKL